VKRLKAREGGRAGGREGGRERERERERPKCTLANSFFLVIVIHRHVSQWLPEDPPGKALGSWPAAAADDSAVQSCSDFGNQVYNLRAA
jgi:hypothetical protein